jgi:hypothetical protein
LTFWWIHGLPSTCIEQSNLVMRRLGPDLLRGIGKSIGGDLNIDDEIF